MLEQVERRPVQPLQIVEEQGERMLCPGEHAEESAEHLLETGLRFLRRQLSNRWLLPDDESEFRNKVGHKRAVHAQRVEQIGTPASQSASLSLKTARTRL